jgi:hypothetical protein
VRLPRALLLAFASGLAWGQDSQGISLGPPDPIFPSDTRDPRVAGGAQLLDVVCPGSVVTGEKIGCGERCPSFTVARDWVGGLELFGVTRGHFLSTSSDDAVLSMIGCAPHSENFGGTILLARGSEGWKMLWYKAGVDTSRCHRVPVENPQEILVCVGSYGGQGRGSTELFVEDLLVPVPSLMASDGKAFFTASDNLGAGLLDCGTSDDGDPGRPSRNSCADVECGREVPRPIGR